MIQSENDFTDSSTQKTEKASIWTPRPKERERTRIKKERRRWTSAAGGSQFCFKSF